MNSNGDERRYQKPAMIPKTGVPAPSSNGVEEANDPRYSSAQVSSFSYSLSSPLHRGGSLPLIMHQRSNVSSDAGGGDLEQQTAASTTTTTTTRKSVSSALATPKLQFFRKDILACINCTTEVIESRDASVQPAPISSSSSSGSPITNKAGPLLMELRKIVLDPDLDEASHFFRTESLCQARGNPNFGSSVSSTCLSVHPEVDLCATGQSTGSLCIHSLSSPAVSSSSNYNNHDESTSSWQCAAPDYYQNGQRMTHRAASAVEWRPQQSHHIAVGLTAGGISSTDNTMLRQPIRLAVSGHGGSTTDREHNCFVWDVEHQRGGRAKTTTPLYRVAHQTGIASLAWALEGQVLVLGNQHRNLQLYDLRTDGTNTNRAPTTVLAHNLGVHGVQCDPAKPFQFLSFSRSVGEPVKLWDARRMTSSVTEIKLGPSALVQTAEWATQGKLTLLVGSTLHCYDTLSGARPVFSRSYHLESPPNDFATYPYDDDERQPEDATPFTTYLKKRVFVTRHDKTITDAAFHRSAPLSVSKHSGQIINAFACDITFQPPTHGPLPIRNCRVTPNEDISATMIRRAAGNEKGRYAVDVETNMRFLLDEAQHADGETERQTKTRKEIYNVWHWVHWIEELLKETTDKARLLLISTLQFRGLHDAGVITLLNLDKNGQDLQGISKTLAVATFDSKGRRAALTSCGWPGHLDLSVVMNGREADGDYERAAALAVWYGDIGSAVDVLKRGVKAYKEQGALKYSETMELIMISIAGFRSGNDDSAAVWRKASGALLHRIDNDTSLNHGDGYLQHIIRFLMCVGDENAHKGLIRDSKLSLCDRVGFACQFFSQPELRQYLDFCITECRETGNIEGLTITGMDINGIDILQSFVDQTADVQTVTLLTSRVIFPEKSMEQKIAWEWLNEYRSLLNRWQMWHTRAKFDVERADMLRSVHLKTETNNVVAKRHIPINRRKTLRGNDPDIQAPIPAQLDARCNYCSASLGLRKADSQAWHSKTNGVLTSCPACRKPLPRCSICMLSLGTLNPHVKLTNNHSNLPFAEWFTWCVRCRHGGHAHHLVSWFSKHNECPISGCDCQCQFDSQL